MKKKILIIGNGANAYALAKLLSTKHDIYITPSSDALKEFASCLDIREDNVKELLEFVVENDINLTVPVSQISIQSDIATVFAKNNQAVFAPSASAARFVYDKAFAKKTFYKLRIPTPKFGIFEKQNMVLDYIKNLKIPFVLKTDDNNSAAIFTSFALAKPIVEASFIEKNKRIIIEDYIYGTPFAFYAITDGYKALPIGSSIIYKHSLEGDGGQLTSGMGACSPNYKLSVEQEFYIMDSVIYPLIEAMEADGNNYLGFIGINGIMTDEGKIWILGVQPFMQDCDSALVLSNIEDDLYDLMDSCVIGSFSDEAEHINTYDRFYASLTLNCTNKVNKENIICGLENISEDTFITMYPSTRKNRYLEYEAEYGNVMSLATSAPTLSSAIEKMYNEAKEISFSGIMFRKDIGRSFKN